MFRQIPEGEEAYKTDLELVNGAAVDDMLTVGPISINNYRPGGDRGSVVAKVPSKTGVPEKALIM